MLFAKLRAEWLGRDAAGLFIERGWAAAEKLIVSAKRPLQAGAWAHLGVDLHNAGRFADARRAMDRALDLEPDRADVLLFLAEVEEENGDVEEACALFQRALNEHPGWAAAAVPLGRLLLAGGDSAGAIEVLSPLRNGQAVGPRLLLAKALFSQERHEDVVALLEPMVKQVRLELRTDFGGDRGSLVQLVEEAERLFEESFAFLHGREQVIESALVAGDLNARAGVNYRLLGEARMAADPPWHPEVKLRSVEDSIAFGRALQRRGEASRGLCHLGAADLRLGKLSSARNLFEQAREADDDNFAAFLGIGAVLDYEARRVFSRISELRINPEQPPEGLLDIVTDWQALTSPERCAVIAAAAPLSSLLPRAAAAGGRARVLPIDARPVDLGEMSQEAGERDPYDERVLDAITGAATREVCVSKIESLLDVGSEGGWVFAHELAHLLHFHAPESVQTRIDRIWKRLGRSDYVLTEYQRKNVHEFFAVAYVDYLDRVYGFPATRELDDGGLMEQAFGFFSTLGTTPAS